MSLCIGICQMDEFGYCTGCGRSQAEIDGGAPATPDPSGGEQAPCPQASAPGETLFDVPAVAAALTPPAAQSAGR